MSDKEKASQGGGRIWDFFASVRLSFVLLIALAVSSVLGTLLPQKEHASVYAQQFGEAGARIILGLRLNDMYHAPWFLLLLALLAVNLLICSLNRLPGVLKLMAKDPQADLKRAAPAQESFSLAGAPEAHLAAAEAALRAAIGPATQGKVKDALVLFAQKGAWTRLGVYVVHSSVLVIMAGAIVGNLWGFAGQININQGATVDHVDLDTGEERPLGFSLRLDKFTVSYYPDGMPSEYRSDITFIEDGREVDKVVLVVNDPAQRHGIDFYQASYGQSVNKLVVRLTREGQAEQAELKHGAWTELAGGAKALLIEARPEINMGGMYKGPVARVGYQPPSGEPFAITAFQAGADIPMRMGGGQPPVKAEILELETAPYSGLQVKYDPGVWLIWVGCTLMVAGFLIAFYGAHRKVWIRLAPAGKGRTKVEIAGSTNKHRMGLTRLLERLAARLQGGAKQGE
ncbi:MAG: cytochrome c biogenesis protein ResB [Thermodesulfobacteriota bacterium]